MFACHFRDRATELRSSLANQRDVYALSSVPTPRLGALWRSRPKGSRQVQNRAGDKARYTRQDKQAEEIVLPLGPAADQYPSRAFYLGCRFFHEGLGPPGSLRGALSVFVPPRRGGAE